VELPPDAGIEEMIRAEIARVPDMEAGVAVYDLAGRRKAEVSGDADLYPASVVKLTVLIEALRQASRGDLVLDRPVRLPAPHASPASRTFGEVVTVSDLLTRMTRHNDHAAANALIGAVGIDAINASIADAGLRGTALNRRFNDAGGGPPNSMPPSAAATVMYRLLRKELLDPESCRRMTDLLSSSPAGATAAGLLRSHPELTVCQVRGAARMRSGREVVNDVAIVTGAGCAYALAVYTESAVDRSAWIATLAGRIHAALARGAESAGAGQPASAPGF
jgi:beta-lactamase class A